MAPGLIELQLSNALFPPQSTAVDARFRSYVKPSLPNRRHLPRSLSVLQTGLTAATEGFPPWNSKGFGLRPDPSPSNHRRGLCRMSRPDITSDLELARPAKDPKKRVNAVFWIILLNLGIYAADHLLQLRGIKSLYLYHGHPEWYQFVTATFCHANWEHLSSNLFFLYIFGKLVEEEEGSLGLWISYILTGAGANLVSWLVLPTSAVSVGASGAVFGLFAVSVLVKMSWDWRKILEVLILGQFVIERVMEAAQASTGLVGPLARGSFGYVNHIAHLSGALIGAALIFLISRVPSEADAAGRKGDKRI